ncbi:MAG: carbon-phosphorus lyase complex subunit PhnI, partial [Gammaproteobacteria bacterium]|nr:carbon-phosphorus lyase complex subunit PhnI [Gammaproteobacteria bacterium]
EITECEVVAMYDEQDARVSRAQGCAGATDEQGSSSVAGATESGGKSTVKSTFTLGYGACFGHNEIKAISMAILDRALQKGMQDGPRNPSEDPEFVLLHIDGIDSMGFCTHYKMPHYVTFQSDMDRLRATQQKQKIKEPES